MLLLQNGQGEVLLQQRPPSGIWGGLWSLPECPEGAEPATWCRERFGLELSLSRTWEPLVHTFSHFQLEIAPVQGRVKAGAAAEIMEPGPTLWYKTQSFNQLGLPAPVKRLLQRLA